jgi:hypothetical protein
MTARRASRTSTSSHARRRRPSSTSASTLDHARTSTRFHRAGVDAGFRSNGGPGLRDYAPGYYAAYLFDPDGNNVEALYRDVGNPGHPG